MDFDVSNLLLASLGLFLGGILKGATGAGTPIIAVPVIATVYSVPVAVAVMSISNLLSNVRQAWQFRETLPSGPLTKLFAVGGFVGAVIGTFMLKELPAAVLTSMIGLVVLAYIGFRISRPDWRLSAALGRKLSVPFGTLGGVLQGSVGVSAPVSISFLNALSLPRPAFIPTISVYFAVMSVAQIPFLVLLDLLSWEMAIAGTLAFGPIHAGMELGGWMALKINQKRFQQVTLALLAVIAAKLLVDPWL